MIVSQGSAESFLRMFHGLQSEMTIAILILSARRKETELFGSLIDGLAEVDQALGREVGLFLFYPNSQAALSAWDRDTKFIGGERFTFNGKRPSAMEAREFFYSVNPDDNPYYRDQIQRTVAQSSAEIVDEFCTIFEIDPASLPCVCTLIKGVHKPIVSKAGERLSYARLVEAAHSIRRELESIRTRAQFLIEGVHGLERSLVLAEQSAQLADRKRDRVLSLIGGLEQKFNVTLSPQISAMLALRTLTVEGFEAVVSEVANERADQILRDSRSSGIKTAVSKWCEAINDLSVFSTNYRESDLETRATQIESVRTAIEKIIQAAYADAGISVFQFSQYAGSVAKLSGAMASISKLIAFLRTLSGQ